MPGGSPAAWPHIKKIFQDISAKTSSGEPCCDWVGEGGSGHYVKMVHNGIEYGDMQILSEAYLILKDVIGLSCDEMYVPKFATHSPTLSLTFTHLPLTFTHSPTLVTVQVRGFC